MIRLDASAQEHLLGRPLRGVLTAADRRAFEGQRVLVTGAGGSVGSELCRQLAACRPATLTLVDHAEYNLFQIESELRDLHPALEIHAVLADVCRRGDIEHACRVGQPQIVFHAAAYKHVTFAERSVVVAARANVVGTDETLRAAHQVGARVVVISTDKAAQPRSVMGATKRMAELVALRSKAPGPKPVIVRFGNILGSSGSVVEIMLRCIRERRPIPITDENATRYFMTGAEAVALVLKASLIGRGGEVFWLDMGAPLRIGDLARRMIAWATPAGETPVRTEVIGLRPGEKMREELTSQGLAMRKTRHPEIWVARQAARDDAHVGMALADLRDAVEGADAGATLAAILGAVPEFQPSAAAVVAAGAPELEAEVLAVLPDPSTQPRGSDPEGV